jgi:hypothetical protein
LAVEWVATSQAENAVYSVLSQNRHCVAALPKGTKVGPKSRGLRSQLRAGDLFYRVFGSDEKRSYCQVTKQAYVGLQFAIKGKVHYGWARLGYIRTGPNPKAELIGYAYETIPNKPIITGKTKGPDDISVEEPDATVTMPTRGTAALGVLALGSPGLSIWRREESAFGER